jgi:hypothetical protein
MGQWTWLFTKFPLADMELMSDPISVEDANVLVRTFRGVPDTDGSELFYEVRVAPHNVAPFRGGPWIRRFSEAELALPGDAIATFRSALALEIESTKGSGAR